MSQWNILNPAVTQRGDTHLIHVCVRHSVTCVSHANRRGCSHCSPSVVLSLDSRQVRYDPVKSGAAAVRNDRTKGTSSPCVFYNTIQQPKWAKYQ